MEIKRLFDIPALQLKNFPINDCLNSKVNGKWISCSTQQLINQANLISIGLLKMGVKKGDKIAIISNNRWEWHVMDFGILQLGAVDVPVYPTIAEKDFEYIFNNAEVQYCIVSDAELYEKVGHIAKNVPTLKKTFTFNEVAGAQHWTEILHLGKNGNLEELENIKKNISPFDLATLVYTSGTTGNPKGVMLSHNNLVSNILASQKALPVQNGGKSLSFLPICHVYERMIVYLYMSYSVSIYFAESIDAIGDNLNEVQPKVFTAVPRLLEKLFDKIMAKGNELTGIKRILFNWAVDLGFKYEPFGANGWWYEFQLKIARKLIFTKWIDALGGKIEVIASGSAALQPRLARIFHAAGIPILEGYGLSETSPVVSVNTEVDKGICFGTVGTVVNKVTVKIAEDGEILVKGPNVMMGYYKREDLTKEVIDEDGWFHTGDIGIFTDNKFLKITDRKKEIFKTSGGKYIAPQQMENKFKESPFIEQMMVIGENRKHPAALVIPNFEHIKQWCNYKGIDCSDDSSQIICNQKIIDRISKEITKYNQEFGKWEQIKKFELLAKEWSVESGELTPTLKLKRKIILADCDKIICEIYD